MTDKPSPQAAYLRRLGHDEAADALVPNQEQPEQPAETRTAAERRQRGADTRRRVA